MNGRQRVVLLGGSSAFTPALAQELARAADQLPALEVVLFGRHAPHLRGVAAASRALSSAAGADHEWQWTTDYAAALPGARVVVNQIRVGGFAGREHDERFPLAFGYPGDETIGPGGLASAVRSLPLVLELGEATARLAPDAWFLNLTNPLGILVRALSDVPGLRTFGLCELPACTLHSALSRLGLEAEATSPALERDYLGANHQGWFVHLKLRGEDLLPRLFEALADEDEPEFLRISGATMLRLGALPLPYLRLAYHRAREVERGLARKEGRGKQLANLSARLHAHYEEFAAGERSDPLPEAVHERDMPWLSEAVVPALAALLGGPPRELYVSERNGSHVPDLPAEAVLEKRATISAAGATAAAWSGLPPGGGHLAPLVGDLAEVALFEDRALAAARRPTPDSVAHALVAHPLRIPADVARAMAPEVLRPLSAAPLRTGGLRE